MHMGVDHPRQKQTAASIDHLGAFHHGWIGVACAGGGYELALRKHISQIGCAFIDHYYIVNERSFLFHCFIILRVWDTF